MYAGFSGPTFWLRKVLNARIKQIRKSMADVVDLIVLAIEAGLGFDMAVVSGQQNQRPINRRTASRSGRSARRQATGRRVSRHGRALPYARIDLVVAAIAQAMRMGTGLGVALRLQATEIRERRMAFIKEQAGKLPVKMMLPLVLFISLRYSW